jgi:signal peptidase I
MKRFLPFLILSLLLIVGCSKSVDETTLIEKDGLMYLPDSDSPYSGEVFTNYDTGEKLYTGRYENGLLIEYSYINKDGTVKEPINVETTLVERDGIYYTKDTNKPYTGLVFTLYGNGVKKSEIFLKDGEPDGFYSFWHEDGQIGQQGTYTDGKKDGKWTVWDAKGKVLVEYNYNYDQINGFYENDSLRFISTYEITTGGMENTFLIGEKIFIEKIKNNSNMLNEVVLLKYPRDSSSLFLMRVIAGPGDTLEIINRTVYLNGDPYPFPQKTKYILPRISPDYKDDNIFMGKGNKDNFAQTVIPKKGDRILIGPETALLVMQLMLMDDHELTLKNNDGTFYFTMTDPADIYRRKGSYDVFDNYYPNGNLLNPWSRNMPRGELLFDGQPIMDLQEYEVEQNYYWAMGDNRDNSLDSRFWGFVPYSYITHRSLKMNKKN